MTTKKQIAYGEAESQDSELWSPRFTSTAEVQNL